VSDDWRSGYRPVSDDSYRQPNGNGSSGRPGRNGSSSYGSGQGGADGNGSAGYTRAGNGYGPARPGDAAYGRPSDADKSPRSSAMDDPARGNRSVPGGRMVATGRHGTRRGADDGGAPGDDTGAWYRPARRTDSARTTTRRSVRPGYYGPDDDRTGVGGRTGRYGPAGGYGPGGTGGGPGRPGGGPRDPRRGDRDLRALIDPDGQTPLPLKILRRLWYGRWWRHWSFKKVGLLFGGLCATMALALVATFFVVLHSTRVPIIQLEQPLNQSSLVYFSNGKQVGCFCAAGRTVLSEHQIIKKSGLLVAAVLAAEDRAFFTEGGISVTGLLRAAKNDLSGGSIQGGSTITEQFVKTYYQVTGNLSYGTKIKEIFVAIKLAQMEPKGWILTHYLNAIPLGSGANGVEAAAETYFHTNAWQLTVAQAAMIAAMIQAPYGYLPGDPRATPPGLPNSLLQRWIYVLNNMVRDGAITQARFNGLVPDTNPADTNSKVNLKKFPKIEPASPVANWPGYRGYIMQLVQNELAVYYNIHATFAQLGNMGLQIHTTINERMMNALYSDVAQAKAQMAAEGVRLPSYVHITSVLEEPRNGKIRAFYGGPGYGIKHCKRYHCNVDTILQPEPVGSSFKPYVLATAVDEGMDVRKSVLNSHSPLCIPPDWTLAYQLQRSKQTANCHNLGYQIFKEGGEDSGRTNDSVVVATATSNDPAFEDLIHRAGVEKVIQMAGTLGVSQADVHGLNALFGPHGGFPGSVQAALGEGSLSAVDQANTFATLVSGGRRFTPHIIARVYQNGAPLVARLAHFQAVPPAVAADTDYALSFDTNTSIPGATGVPNAVWDGRPMIGKTGTLGQGNNASEAWFIGAIPQYSMSVALFTNRPGGIHAQILDGLPPRPGWAGSYGGAWPATIWHSFMSGQFSQLTAEPLPAPSYTGTTPLFVKWVQALPPKKHKRCRLLPGQGGGNGNGHHHRFFVAVGNGQCPKGGGPGPGNSPTPNPSGGPTPPPTNSPTPNPTVTITTSPNPSGSPTTTPPAPLVVPPHRQRVPGRTANTAGLSSFAIVPERLIGKPASVVTTSLG
jgi:membrane peptidoglycan carboxypeptidase